MTPATSPNPGALQGIRAVAIIPARLGSSRLPRKMLLSRTGRCLFEHTARNVAASGIFARVAVATDSAEIAAAAKSAGIEALMTRADHGSGTDRVFEAWTLLQAGRESAQVIVNVQGDEPEVAHADLARLVSAFADPDVDLATLSGPIQTDEEADDPGVVKVVSDVNGDALYFSRARVPARGHASPASPASPASEASHASVMSSAIPTALSVLRRHIGVYAFTPVALARFCALPTGRLEAHESLEQLRWLEAGEKLRVIEATRVPRGIDTLEDYERFVARCATSTTGPASAGGDRDPARARAERAGAG